MQNQQFSPCWKIAGIPVWWVSRREKELTALRYTSTIPLLARTWQVKAKSQSED